jgi:dihydrofolate reductase
MLGGGTMEAKRKLIYAFGVSLDGYFAGPDGEIDWATPNEELHRFHNEQTAALAASLCGRGLYEDMKPWEARAGDPSVTGTAQEFAQIWKQQLKIVFSNTMTSVDGNARLVKGDAISEVARLKSESGGDLGVGGAGLAAGLIARDLVDEYRLFINPLLLGGGTPFFPALNRRLDLDLLETRQFGPKVVYLRYRRRR